MDSSRRSVWCGVDLGTTHCKVLLLAGDGEILARATRPTPRVADAEGSCTNPDTLFDAVEAMVIEACRTARLTGPLDGLCVGGTGEDGLPLDDGLRPLDHAIAWNDRRADALAAGMAVRSPWLEAELPVAIDGTRTAAKWRWLREYRPERVGLARCWVALTDYPAVRWTRRPFMSETLATRTACFSLAERDWLPLLLSDCGAPPLPKVLKGGTVAGPVVSGRLLELGLVSTDTSVVVGGHDHPMAASLVCGLHPGAVLDSMGTAELVYLESGRTGPLPRSAQFAASLPIKGDAVAWLGVMELSRILEPLLQPDDPSSSLFETVMASGALPGTAGAGGLRYVPEMDSTGFATTADPAERLRAILEGCTLRTARLLHEAEMLLGGLGPIFVAGGWSRSRGFLSLRAAMLGRPLRRIVEPELSALGSAALAASGVRAVLPPVDLRTEDIVPEPTLAAAYNRLAAS